MNLKNNALLAIAVFALSACISGPKRPPLDIGNLPDPTFQLTWVGVSVPSSQDAGGAFESYMEDELARLVQTAQDVVEDDGIRIDARELLSTYEAGRIEVQFEKSKRSSELTIHSYSLELPSNPDQRAEISMVYTPNSDVPLGTVVLEKGDRENDPEAPAGLAIVFSSPW